MNKMFRNIASVLLILLFALGCSDQSSEAPSGQSASSDDDTRAAEILDSSDIMEARDWVRTYPKSLFSDDAIEEDAEGGTPLGPIVERLFAAGAQRVVVHHANKKFYLGLVVVLPTDSAARQKIFAMDRELSQLCQQREARDSGQKYLYYTPD